MDNKSLEDHLIWSYEEEIKKLRTAIEEVVNIGWDSDDPIQYLLKVRWTLSIALEKAFIDTSFRDTMRRIDNKFNGEEENCE